MADSIVGLCEIEFYLPGITSLKEKRGILKSMLARVRNTFNVASAEIAHQDKWQSAKIALVTVSNSAPHVREMMQAAMRWIEENFPEALITRHHMDIL
jgi:uncharacterized protein